MIFGPKPVGGQALLSLEGTKSGSRIDMYTGRFGVSREKEWISLLWANTHIHWPWNRFALVTMLGMWLRVNFLFPDMCLLHSTSYIFAFLNWSSNDAMWSVDLLIFSGHHSFIDTDIQYAGKLGPLSNSHTTRPSNVYFSFTPTMESIRTERKNDFGSSWASANIKASLWTGESCII